MNVSLIVQYSNDFRGLSTLILQIHAALRGAATLRARLQKTTTIALGEEKGERGIESNISYALNFVATGGELLKRTRKGTFSQVSLVRNIKSSVFSCGNNITLHSSLYLFMLMTGALHWKQVSFYINSNWQV